MDNDNKRNSISTMLDSESNRTTIGLKNKTLGTAHNRNKSWKPLTFRSNDRNRFILAKQLTIDRVHGTVFQSTSRRNRRSYCALSCAFSPLLPRIESEERERERGGRQEASNFR